MKSAKHGVRICHCCFREQRSLLEKCAATSLSSKLVASQKDFFSKMVVDAVMMLDELLPLNMIGIKKVQGGALEVRGSPVRLIVDIVVDDISEPITPYYHACTHLLLTWWLKISVLVIFGSCASTW